jgi:mono/diheme cytochrome c family protein
MTRQVAPIALCFLLLARPAYAGEDVGRTLYLRYCAACHGRSGGGDGPVAAALGEKPTDLTQLATQHGGTFAFADVCEAIDGTRSVRAHGVSEMPVWGEVFDSDAASPLEQQILAAGKVMAIARYLRTLQAATPPAR